MFADAAAALRRLSRSVRASRVVLGFQAPRPRVGDVPSKLQAPIRSPNTTLGWELVSDSTVMGHLVNMEPVAKSGEAIEFRATPGGKKSKRVDHHGLTSIDMVKQAVIEYCERGI
jgi:hypothetical protein